MHRMKQIEQKSKKDKLSVKMSNSLASILDDDVSLGWWDEQEEVSRAFKEDQARTV